MKPLKVLIVTLLFLFLAGCSDFSMICSLNPFYVDHNITMVREIEGKWKANTARSITDTKDKNSTPWKQVDTASVWKVERFISKETHKDKHGKDSVVLKPLNYYMVHLISNKADSVLYKFKMVLFRVNKVLYADFMPIDNTGLEKSLFASESYFQVHTLARVVIRNNQLGFSWLGAEYMKDMIEKKRVRVNYMWVKSASRLLLTATPEQLTGMIERYAGETRFIDWDNQKAMLKFNRIK